MALVSFVAGLLVWSGLFWNVQAAELSHSPWLPNWFGTSPYKALPPLAAIDEGLIGTFFKSRTYFNGNLWTMSYELFGSFLSFALALVVVDLRRPKVSLALTAILFVIVLSWSPYYAHFVAGVGMAQLYALRGERLPRLRIGWIVGAGLAAFLLFGFRGAIAAGDRPVGFYAALRFLPKITASELQVLLHTVSALLILCLVMSSPFCRRTLGGRLGAWLGRLSFPIYLTHLVVICSVGSLAFVRLSGYMPHAPAVGLSIAATVAVSFAVSYPVMVFDLWWVRQVNALAGRLKHDSASGFVNQPAPAAFPVGLQYPSRSAA